MYNVILVAYNRVNYFLVIKIKNMLQSEMNH